MANAMKTTRSLFSRLAGCLACLLALLALLPSGALAETSVSGAISQNTTWSASQSPYLLLVDIVIDNGATLRIEAGTTLRMARGASLIVKNGALQAAGSAAAPVVITASSEATGNAAPGDWGQLRFLPGTVSASSFLENVQIRYGAGLAIEKASPTLRNLALQNHRGAAIGIDLASSPLGSGLSASGNDINGIVVPAGTLTGSVQWGLVGIPYLIAQGWVNIGQAPIALEPGALTLNPGVQASLRVHVATPAPAGGLRIDLSSSVPSAAAVPASVTIPEGATWVDLPLEALAVGDAILTASQAQRGSATASIKVAHLPALQLQPGAATLGINRPLPMSVSLPEPAPAGGVGIALSSSDPDKLGVPATLNIAAGQRSAAFAATGMAEGDATVLAQATGYASTTARLAVRPRALVLPLTLLVAPGASANAALSLTEPAPAGGLSVNLASHRADIASVPASLRVPAGESSASFTVQGLAAGTATLTASASAYQPGSSVVTVDSIGIDLDPAGDVFVPQGVTTLRRVRLSKPAPASGATIALGSSDSAIAAAEPAEVFVPPGQTVATRSAGIRGVAKGKADVTLAAAGMNGKTVKVEVSDPAALRIVSVYGENRMVLGKGMKSYVQGYYVERTVNGARFNGVDALTVNLACVSAAVCATPATVTIPAGQGYAFFQASGIDVGNSELKATASGYGDAAAFNVDVVNPELGFGGLDGSRSLASARDDFYLHFKVPGARYVNQQTVVADTAVNLSLSDQNPAGIVGGIYDAATGGNAVMQVVIPAGRNDNADRPRHIERPTAAGSYTVTAALPGVTSAVSAIQSVTAPALRIVSVAGQSHVLLGKGLKNYIWELYVERTVNGTRFNGSEALTVHLACASATLCTGGQVTIPAGQGYAYFQVSGVEVGNTELKATANGYGDATGFKVNVVNPELEFINLDGSRSLASVRDDFYLRFKVPGAYYAYSQTAAVDAAVSLSLSEQNPAGIVGGIYDAATGGNAVTQIVIPAGSSDSSTRMRHIERPTAAGSYTVTATLPGTTRAVSAVQTVTAPALRVVSAWGNPAVVGKGMKNYFNIMSVEQTVNGVPFNGAENVTVNLACASAAVCTGEVVTIPAGRSGAYVQVTGVEVGSSELIATATGYGDATGFRINVVNPTISFSNLDGSRSQTGTRDDFFLYINTPGGAGPQPAATDILVDLTVTDQNPVGIVGGFLDAPTNGNAVTQAVITAGRNNSADRPSYIEQPTAAGSYTVTATLPGIASAVSAVQTVAAPALRLGSQWGGNSTVLGKGMKTYSTDLYVERTVNGTRFNGTEALTVNLACASTAVCTTPATVTIPAGQGRAHFQATGVDPGNTAISASAAGYGDAQGLATTVVLPAFQIINWPTVLATGASANFFVNISTPGAFIWQTAASPVTVTLSNAVPGVADLPATATIAADSNQSPAIPLKGLASGDTRVTASAPGVTPQSSATLRVQP